MTELYQAIFKKFPDAMAILNEDSIIVDLNNAFEKLFKYQKQDIIGRDIDDLINKQEDRDSGRELFKKAVNNGRVTIAAERYTSTGEAVHVLITGYPLTIDSYTGGHCVTYRDISSEINKDQLLLEKEQFTDQLFNKSLYPIAILDCQEIILNANSEFERLFEYSKEELIGSCINDLIVPEQHLGQAEKYLKTIQNGESMMEQTRRMTKSGELIDVEAVGSPITIDDEIIGLFAMYRDIRVEKQALEALSRERVYFKQLFEHSPDPTVLLDDTDRVVFINPAFEKLFGYRLTEVQGHFINELIISKKYLKEATDLSNQVMKDGKTLRLESIRTSKDGKDIEVEIIAYPVFLEGDRLGAYAIYRDITERRSKERMISKLAYRDSLTGIPNRLYAYERLTSLINRAAKQNGRVALLYFDLDGFKEINDSRGHKIGDLLLSKMANKVNNKFKGRMEICRVGGDEFLGIIRQPDEDNPERFSNELKELFKEDFLIKGEPFRLGLSIGTSVYPDDGIDLDHLISKADSRMYFEKRINRIRNNPERKTISIEELLEHKD